MNEPNIVPQPEPGPSTADDDVATVQVKEVQTGTENAVGSHSTYDANGIPAVGDFSGTKLGMAEPEPGPSTISNKPTRKTVHHKRKAKKQTTVK